jgi:single-stranded-DNA-specific exonuclease
VVPLTGVNRAFVAQGLKILAARGNTGLRTVLDLASITETPGVYACGFVIGPRINAGGRVGKADLGVRLLTSMDDAEALGLARELEQHNAERKAIEAMVLEEAQAQAEAMEASTPLLVVAGKGWHPGVIGIVAGRLKERFYKPVAVVAINDGIGKASARSVSGFDFGAAVIAAHASGLLLAGGGHAMAAGFSVEADKIAALAEFLQNRMRASGDVSSGRTITLDGLISIAGATPELIGQLDRLGPFGQGNPSIRLAVQNVVNLRPEIVGEHHVKTLFIDRLSNMKLSGIAFRCVGTKLGDVLLSTRGQTLDIAGQLRVQEWNGKRSVSITVDDVRLARE